jgi:hypothetical protein
MSDVSEKDEKEGSLWENNSVKSGFSDLENNKKERLIPKSATFGSSRGLNVRKFI